MVSVYDSERLAAAYAYDRPSVHEQFVRSAGLSQQVGRPWTSAAARGFPPPPWCR
jgi:hypothetical protein